MSWIYNFFTAVPYFIVLIGVLIFVHEAGHFVFAKLFKVKVHVFSLGFGPKLLGLQRGETLYQVSIVPIGGYVKMLGEDPTEEVKPEDRGRAFSDKPLIQRFLIIAGGPFMNIIFPLFLHFGVGLSFTEVIPAEVGIVIPGMPADKAGIRSGDVIDSVNGTKINSFTDLVEQVSPRPAQEIRMGIRRGDEIFERTIIPKSVEIPIILEEKETVGRIGVGPGYPSPLIGVADPESIASQAGLATFDLIVSLNSTPVTRLIDLEKGLIKAAGSTVALEVKHLTPDAKPPFYPLEDQFTDKTRNVSLEIPAKTNSLSDLGIESSANFVAFVTPGGAANKIGLERGDRLASLDGKLYPFGQIFVALNQKPDKSRILAWTRGGKKFSKPFKQKFIPAGEAGDLGLKRDTYDKGFWGLAGKAVLPSAMPNPSIVSSAIRHAISETWEGLRFIGIGFKSLIQGKISMRSLGGPIMIGQLAGQAGQRGAGTFFWIMALISLNLGVLNLLPIPVLDGGQIVFIVIESVIRQPINRAIKEWVMLVGVAMVLILMVFATWNDIARLVVG
ncbi:MAG: RIP metalloprotease RseP [Proteobacteria bacterium]|nr:RIP metalloprotease RseP [Pseudomonadota bacterium]